MITTPTGLLGVNGQDFLARNESVSKLSASLGVLLDFLLV